LFDGVFVEILMIFENKSAAGRSNGPVLVDSNSGAQMQKSAGASICGFKTLLRH
jgi:hypothetical protein